MSDSFQDISKLIVQDFLHTAVLFDDKAFSTNVSSVSGELIVPVRGSTITSSNTSQPQIQTASLHGIDTKKIISAFASKGLVCSVLCPDSIEDIEREVKNVILAAIRTDIVIIDWEIYSHVDGQIAIQIIKAIIDNDLVPERLRFICIYTGANDLATTISDTIKREVFNNNTGDYEFDDQNLIFKKNSLIISLIGKEGIGLPEGYEKLEISEEALPDKIIDIFSNEFSGLLPIAAMMTLSSIRNNGHKILAKFPKMLDESYLTHRANLPKPSDSEDHLEELINEEIKSVITSDKCISRFFNFKAIGKWIDHNVPDILVYPDGNIELNRVTVKEIIKEGIDNPNITQISKNRKKKFFKHFTKLLIQNPDVSDDDMDTAFANLSIIKTCYMNKKPYLSSGTIIQNRKNKTFWICIQPKCDCLRIKNESKQFPLLPLLLLSEGKYEITIPSLLQNSNELYCIPTIPSYCSIYDFKSASVDTSSIYPMKMKGSWIFLTNNGVRFKYITDLKDEFCQKILNDFAASLSRVGTNPSEWLRRSAK